MHMYMHAMFLCHISGADPTCSVVQLRYKLEPLVLHLPIPGKESGSREVTVPPAVSLMCFL